MYEFDLVVKPSGIPGANLGAFITFTQAFGWNETSKTYDKLMDQAFFDGRNLSIDLGKYHRKEGKLQTIGRQMWLVATVFPKSSPSNSCFPHFIDVVDDEPFVLKSFIFCQRPDVYAYTLKQKPQKTRVDISSNTSGEPHEHATAQVPMYGTFSTRGTWGGRCYSTIKRRQNRFVFTHHPVRNLQQ